MRRHGLDKGLWAVALSALLVLSSVSLLFCPTAQAHDSAPAASPAAPDHTPTEASKTALTVQSDDDGDELLEHWSDPKFAKEERLQTAGIVVLLACAAGASAQRRQRLRKVQRHD